MRRIFALCIKEFIVILKNKKSRLVLIIPPVAQLIVFGYAATFDLKDVGVAIYNEDTGWISREIISHFAGSRVFRIVANITHEDQIAPMVMEKKALMVLHFPRYFSRDILRGSGSHVQLILDGRNSNTALIALNYANSIVATFNRQWLSSHDGVVLPAVLKTRSWFNRQLDSHWFIIPGIVGLLTLVVTLEVIALSIAKEKESGTFDQLLVTPFRPWEILVGKSLPGLIIGLLEGSFIIFMICIWFEIPLRGSIVALYLGLFTFLMSAVGIGLMISTISITQQQALMGAFMFLVPSVVLSGFATPISNMPELVQRMTLLNPMRYMLIIVRSVFL